MGTAVLQPQDCLSPRHFLPASECPSAATRSSRRGSSAQSKGSSSMADCAINRSSCNTDFEKGRGLLGRKDSSAGLLPLPHQAIPNIQPSFHRSALDASSLHSRHSSDLCLSRCPSMSSLDYETPATRWFSDCSSMLVERVHVRRPHGGNHYVAIVPHNCLVGSRSCVAGIVPSYQKLRSLVNSHVSDVNDLVGQKWVKGTHWSIQFKERMHAELPQLEGRQSLKPQFKALTGAQGKPTCKVINTVDRKHGVSRQLKRSASEKFLERTKMSVLHRPSTKEAGRKLITSLFEEVDKCKSSGSPASCVEATIEGTQRQGSLEVGPEDSCRKFDSHRWLSMNNDEKWAGPSFFNSPAPSALPVPTFTSTRVTSICSVSTHAPDSGAQDNSFPAAKCMWDVNFATKDLRRMLNLDGSSLDR